MDVGEISAFAAFAQKKAKSLQKKSKSKQKKKARLNEGLFGPIEKITTGLAEPSTSGVPEKKVKKKNADNKDLIKSLLEAQKESIFKGCAVTSKVDNMFLNNMDSGSDVLGSKKVKKSMEELIKHKKNKGMKLMNGNTENYSVKNSQKGLESSSHINDDSHNVKINNMVPEVNLSERANGVSELKKSEKRKLDNSKSNFLKKKMKKTEHNFVDYMTDNFSLSLSKEGRVKELGQKSKLPEIIYADSMKIGEEVLSWMLSPLSVKEFFKTCWEQKPLHIQHNNKNYFKQICTLEDFKEALREHDMYFTRNIDITSYIDDERHTENPEGKAKPSQVWDFYKNGRSIRLLNPQTFIRNVRVLNSTLQEFFHCFVGANIYLTPPGTQGFAPHYDDIEAFVLQLEGEKHWKLYNPRSPSEVLPRESSRNFKQSEIGEPILEVTLQPGDLLYFPRGVIHQAKCLPHVHSLHITVSCYQKNSWADLLEKAIPVAVQKAISEDVELRKGLPIGYLNYLGLIHSDQSSDHRAEILKKFEKLAQRVLEHLPMDAAIDQLAADYIHDALPPCLTEAEELYGGDRNCRMENENFLDVLRNSSEKNLSVKLIRSSCVRLVAEEGEIYLYYTTDNSLVYHEHEASSLCISSQWAQAVEYLIRSYPNFVEMKALPVSEKTNKPSKWRRIVEFVYFLWQKGLLLFDQPLRQICT